MRVKDANRIRRGDADERLAEAEAEENGAAPLSAADGNDVSSRGARYVVLSYVCARYVVLSYMCYNTFSSSSLTRRRRRFARPP